LWDDSSAQYGEKHYMILHYFLADDTIELREEITHQTPGSTRISNSVFLRRHRLPKHRLSVACDGSRAEDVDTEADGFYYTDKDIMIGSVLSFYGRPIVVCDCDPFTREHYRTKFNVGEVKPIKLEEFGKVDAETGAVVLKKQETRAAPAKQDVPDKPPKKAGVDENTVLRFDATMKSTRQVDRERSFILAFYPSNGTFMVRRL
jgi:hypothetical protein